MFGIFLIIASLLFDGLVSSQTDMEHQRDSSVDVRMRDKIVTTLPNFRQTLLEIGHLLF
jgi:hypothetical protein